MQLHYQKNEGKVTVRGIPVDQVQIDAAEWNHGGYSKADLVPDQEPLLLKTLDHMYARMIRAGLRPPYLQLIDQPFYRFFPVPIKFDSPGGAIVTNPITRPAGLMGWVRYERKIALGGANYGQSKILLP